MYSIKLDEYGFEHTLNEVSKCLELAKKSNSKKQKNEMICKAIGAIDTLYYVIYVETDTEDESEV